MQKGVVRRTSVPPRAGDQVWISPAAGVHGRGTWWAVVVSTTAAIVDGTAYLRVVPLDDNGGDARVQTCYVRLAGLLVRSTP